MDALVLPQPSAEARLPVLEFQAGRPGQQGGRLLGQDLREGARLWRLAVTLGWLDIKLRYRGSLLGPFWLTLSTGAMVGSLGVLYATLWKMNVREYLPYLALSQVLWGFIAMVVSEGCTLFTSVETLIRSVRMPFFVHAQRLIVRNALVLAHNALVVIVMFAVLDTWPGWRALYALPAILVWVVDGMAIGMLLGAMCARFRDIPPIVGSLMQIFFFLTPVIWTPKQLPPGLNWVMLGNPFFDVLEVARAPLLGAWPGTHVWIAALVFSALLCGIAWWFLARARGRIAFWI
ncbi:MAG TPA: ABC transporter permease [Acetobacteraceae bacterium]|nr:ABC transporter permease [Acetobacteraceae bacterium]